MAGGDILRTASSPEAKLYLGKLPRGPCCHWLQAGGHPVRSEAALPLGHPTAKCQATAGALSSSAPALEKALDL